MKRSRFAPADGVAFGAGAYACWGMFPAFFGLLAASAPLEILAHRIVWTAVLMVLVVAMFGRIRPFFAMGGRSWGLVAAASLFITINWGVYIFGVVTGRVVETALGYFINPLVSVVFGVLLFRERLSRAQLVAVVIAVTAVVVLTLDYGRPPVIALCLAFSFAMYGVVKKVMPLDPRLSVAGEALIAAPFALGFLIVLGVAGSATFVSEGPAHAALLIAAGPVTAVPLLLFAVAVQRVPLVTMGILQYLTPALQMAWGILVLREDMPASRWLGFALIWCALAVFTADSVRRARRRATARAVVPQGAP
ncbi:EamA family transporter RarD [Hoyosella sp. YIM 151337]|uniref:EamA family transporter RarD n=1 Tax=Hoyosella sp. YIM 151337 TaxID=2992742 RepID=UPI00223548FD|nr:EamA family transporter RarD [Hoyosella sp. YIM 151337]MCW4355474.1 EamA family transporter RarD [Hoyosella sp. YIM 151337]